MSTINICQDHSVDAQLNTSPKVVATIWIWFTVLFLDVGWLGITPIYSPPHWSAIIFFVLGVAFFAGSFRKAQIAPLPRKYLGFLIPLGVSIIFVPWPYNLGSLFLSASIILMAASDRRSLFRPVTLALGASGLVMLLVSAVQPLLFKIFAHSHGAPWAARIVHVILRSIGEVVSVNGSVLYLQTFEELMPINITWEALGFYAVVDFMVVGAVLLLVLRVDRTRWLAFLSVLLIYPIIRYPIMLLVYRESGQVNLFWSSWLTMLTFIPLPILIGRFVTPDVRVPESVSWPQVGFGYAAIRVLLASGAATVCIIGLFSFQDPGVRKHGRILIDEAHSNWERTTQKYDTLWYNEASGYNYYCLADYLGHFYHVDRGTERITPDVLSRYDILILKTLTKPLQQEEVDAIVDFVQAGGGLWLVGDHTNVFGISAHMNPLAQRFGISFKYDATYDLTSGKLTTYEPSVILPHPTVQHMPPVFLFGTSCSIDADLRADYPIIGYGLRGLRADYARDNFFPENKLTLDHEFGFLVQQAAIGYGRGRVVAFSDSTVFSNFWFYMPGKSELCLGTVNWLNYSNRWGFIRWLLAIAAVTGLALIICWSRAAGLTTVAPWILAGSLVSVPIGTHAFSALNRAAYSLPKPTQRLPRIAFERNHCSFTLPSEVWDPSAAIENNYHTFFVWTQRLGYMPMSTPSLDTSLANARALVLINPNKVFSAQELLSVKRYLWAGGRVLVLDGAHNKESVANQLLGDYGIKIEDVAFPQSWVFDRNGRKIAAVELARPVVGGEPVLRIASNKTFVTAAKVGKGLIAVIGSSHLFADRSMGTTSTIPNEYQSGIYEIEFWLFRNLMEGQSDPKLWDPPQPM